MRGEAVPPEPKAKSSARKRKRGKQPAKDPADEPNGEATEGDGDVPAGGDGDDGADLPTADGGSRIRNPREKHQRLPLMMFSANGSCRTKCGKKQHYSMCCVLKTKSIWGYVISQRIHVWNIYLH